MTSNDGAQDGATRALLRDLQALGRRDARDGAFHADLRARLLQQAQTLHDHETLSPVTARSGRPRPAARRLRTRVACSAAAALLALSGVAGYLRLSGPTPASADTMRILRHAVAALRLAPNEAVHATYSVTVTAPGDAAGPKGIDGLTGTADVWVQADAGGVPALSAQTLSMSKSGMTSRYVQAGGHVYAYNPEMRGDNTILLDAEPRGIPSWVLPNSVFDGADVAQRLSALTPQQVRALPQQTVAGHTADVIEVDGWINRPAQRTTFYFDAQDYQLLGFDADSLDPSYPMPAWQARLSGYATMPAASVPPHTFTLNAPATAQLHNPDLGDPATLQGLQAAFAAACHGGAGLNLKRLLVSGQTLLAACQATAPGVTQSDLVAALAAPEKAGLDAAVATGQLTPAQAAGGLATWQAWLSAFVTTAQSAGT